MPVPDDGSVNKLNVLHVLDNKNTVVIGGPFVHLFIHASRCDA
jgi:hypothetical protein